MAAQLVISDPTLKQALLAHLVQQLESNPECLDQMIMSGVSGSLIDHLRSRATAAELCRVSGFSRPDFTLTFDDKALMSCFEQSARVMRDEQVKEYLARNGATTEQLSTWYSMARSDADALRIALASNRSVGRPRLPPSDIRDAIQAAWCAIASPEKSERDSYFELHHKFPDLNINALYQVVHEHDDDGGSGGSPPRRPSPSSSASTMRGTRQ